ncbi:hypothetical protein CYY_007989 [Polysphondylium violaceum]|uniref:Uncharacterized protein n=1 Tax=Polysphondylium violaceum TaxID=133409 RepID=A0A8J4PNZ2_9MYCE|nr:hypothetical protein CYY_007989 [Polysphondylium violaceum]
MCKEIDSNPKKNSFFSVWRNKYTRNLIRNLNIENKCIDLNSSYLVQNYQLLSLLDTDRYNILLRLHIHISPNTINNRYQLYLNSPFQYLINSIKLDFKETTDGTPREIFNLSAIPHYVKDMVIQCSNSVELVGKFPRQLKKLELKKYQKDLVPGFLPRESLNTLVISEFKHSILPESLPTSLKYLHLPDLYDTQISPGVLTKSLQGFKVTSFTSYLSQFKVSSNYMYILQETKGIVQTIDDLQQLPTIEWLTNVEISYFKDFILEPNSFPQLIETLYIHRYPQPLGKDTLPKRLKTLRLDQYNHSLGEGDLLPHSLRHLHLGEFDKPLFKRQLPPNLSTMTLNRYNQPLLPLATLSRLHSLALDRYNHPLSDTFFPPSLKSLKLGAFNHQLSTDTLPRHLEKLYLLSYKQDILPNSLPPNTLKHLSLLTLSSARCNAIPNSVESLFIYSDKTDNDGLDMANIIPPSVTKLLINANGNIFFPWYSHQSSLQLDTIPNTVKHLELYGINHNNNTIPKDCHSLKTDSNSLKSILNSTNLYL